MGFAVEAEGLTKTYNVDGDEPVDALRGIDLEVPEGRIFGLLGRNGQGKSTTVRILTGLTDPSDGHARVLGFDVTSDRRAVQQRIGVTLQDVALDELQTGREHLVLVGSIWGFDRASARRRADELLEEFGLGDGADRLVRTYSGGMRRRLDLATSLLNEPEVLFLDEPTTGLDPQSRRVLWARIRRLRDDGATVFLTTQYLEEADELSDELAIVDQGRILANGTPEQLRSDLGTTRIDVRITDYLDRSAVLAKLYKAGPVVDGEWLHIESDNPGVAAKLVGDIASVMTPDEISVNTTSLEEIFLSLTGAAITGNDSLGSGDPQAELAS